MSKVAGPRVGTRAHKALTYLDGAQAGGISLGVLMKAVDWKRNGSDFNREVVDTLIQYGLAACCAEGVTITRRGELFLHPQAPQDAPQLQMVVGRYVAPIRVLSAKNRPRVATMRPGALDYRDVPSRMSNQLKPHGQKAPA